jgi:hypothetical protein
MQLNIGNIFETVPNKLRHVFAISFQICQVFSLRIFVFVTFLVGNIIFVAYRASFTSELTSRRSRMDKDTRYIYLFDLNLLTFIAWKFKLS